MQMALRTFFIFVGLFSFLAVPHNLCATEPDGYAAVRGPCNFVFPKDYGIHPDHRTEWWYYTGNLKDEQGRPFGFQFTVFRSRLAAPGKYPTPVHPSPWRTEQVYWGHAAVSDIAGQQFLQADEAARGAVGLAGVNLAGDTVQVYFKNWQALIGPQKHHIAASGKHFSYALDLTPKKPVTANGEGGYSRKGRRPESASCYYSITRFAVQGELILGQSHHSVNGTAWMDREYSSEFLEDNLTGWDWFALHFEDGQDLMYFFLRLDDGSLSEASSGTLVSSDGKVEKLTANDMQVEDLAFWTSPESGARYPIRRRLISPRLGLDVTVTARLDDQEMSSERSSGMNYYEGSVAVAGRQGSHPIAGLGYMEMTGYDIKFGSRRERNR